MTKLPSQFMAFAVAVPLSLSVVGAVIVFRPAPEDAALTVPADTPTSTATPTRTPSPTATSTPRPPTATPTAPRAATPPPAQVIRNLTGIRFGMIDVVSNPTGQELPFPAEFTISTNFLLDSAGKRVQYGLDSPPLLPTLTGAAPLGADFSEDGGHGVATGTGRFMGVTTDFSVDFFVDEMGMSARVTIGKGGNLPGGEPVELTISVAEAWPTGP